MTGTSCSSVASTIPWIIPLNWTFTRRLSTFLFRTKVTCRGRLLLGSTLSKKFQSLQIAKEEPYLVEEGISRVSQNCPVYLTPHRHSKSFVFSGKPF